MAPVQSDGSQLTACGQFDGTQMTVRWPPWQPVAVTAAVKRVPVLLGQACQTGWWPDGATLPQCTAQDSTAMTGMVPQARLSGASCRQFGCIKETHQIELTAHSNLLQSPCHRRPHLPQILFCRKGRRGLAGAEHQGQRLCAATSLHRPPQTYAAAFLTAKGQLPK